MDRGEKWPSSRIAWSRHGGHECRSPGVKVAGLALAVDSRALLEAQRFRRVCHEATREDQSHCASFRNRSRHQDDKSLLDLAKTSTGRGQLRPATEEEGGAREAPMIGSFVGSGVISDEMHGGVMGNGAVPTNGGWGCDARGRKAQKKRRDRGKIPISMILTNDARGPRHFVEDLARRTDRPRARPRAHWAGGGLRVSKREMDDGSASALFSPLELTPDLGEPRHRDRRSQGRERAPGMRRGHRRLALLDGGQVARCGVAVLPRVLDDDRERRRKRERTRERERQRERERER